VASDGTGQRASILEEHKPYLRQRWNAGCTDAVVLHRELRARGYQGGYSLIRDYLAPFRSTAVMPAPAPAVPKTRAVTRWIMTRPASLTRVERVQLDAILQSCPELAAVTAHIRGFAAMMTGRRGPNLEKRMTTAAASGDPALRSFVTGLRTVRMVKYSVPARLIGRRVRVSLRASEVLIFDGRDVVARHARVAARTGCAVELDHYLEVLKIKTGALPGSTALARARASGSFTEAHDSFWAA
jgi:hypothetical protein